ncbi:hypothetical protein KL918_004129 [Ogataea parapolymorpha]|uniref:dihydropyrimidinase n=1 Tax=Ogataea parapolymorpha (strain ATCC 26012 / BCRC 20466 / JCM 22074 / NRRL Y-7560 / DL-1) TaxID=871575 RepID=W1QDZ0_OGAPD|nr:dihydropyrimidinase [Ogataea parapolymorpha DL-1]ESW98128.1 dihydropyrimidinase [Ogataea parapolymorpha DL-1]KAG7866140.1 hypothetical protein KL918_004129 [Ogataea parapolymorpha]KAG7874706.1 hypothetical protein KL916_000950 [Ogataea parapolymorpha]
MFSYQRGQFDLVIHNGLVVVGSDVMPPSTYIGVKGGIIEQISATPLTGKKIIDAEGGYIMPGGIDSHVHLSQKNTPAGDTFESGTRSAPPGGTTTVIPFAIQNSKEDFDLVSAVEEYHTQAKNNSYCDYGFHVIISNPNDEILKTQLPLLAQQHGITSVKVYTTYPRYRLSDEQLLDILLSNRKLGITTMIHAENADIIDFIGKKLEEKKLTDPFYHSVSRPKVAEDEATYRVISLSKMIDVPILIVHMSSETALATVREAQNSLVPIFAETCPQYLFLTADYLKHQCSHHVHKDDPFEGAKYICSPPLRQSQSELDGVWRAIQNGTVTVFSSDHAPTIYDHPLGKKAGLVNGIPHYKKVPNGLPGIETRMPLLFCKGVETGKITAQRYVELCCSNPAKLYGLDQKGTIAVGKDADFVIWYPKGKMTPFTLTNSMLHHGIDYSPFEGVEFTNWPRYTILRGSVVWDRDSNGLLASKSTGQYVKRAISSMPGPVGKLSYIFE